MRTANVRNIIVRAPGFIIEARNSAVEVPNLDDEPSNLIAAFPNRIIHHNPDTEYSKVDSAAPGPSRGAEYFVYFPRGCANKSGFNGFLSIQGYASLV